MQNRYDCFRQLQALTAMVQTKNGYAKMVQSGARYSDYGIGFMDFEIEVVESIEEGFGVAVRLNTIDDGGLVGRRYDIKSKEGAMDVADKIAKHILKDMVELPDLSTLNVMLRPYGIYLVYEG